MEPRQTQPAARQTRTLQTTLPPAPSLRRPPHRPLGNHWIPCPHCPGCLQIPEPPGWATARRSGTGGRRTWTSSTPSCWTTRRNTRTMTRSEDHMLTLKYDEDLWLLPQPYQQHCTTITTTTTTKHHHHHPQVRSRAEEEMKARDRREGRDKV